MNYDLYHKDVKVLTINYEPELNKFGEVVSIYDENHIPIGLQNGINPNLSRSIQLWWESRLIPKNRISHKLYSEDINRLVSDSYGFNLSDHYWIKPSGSDMTWGKGNFFTNDFSEDIGKFIIGDNFSEFKNMSSSTPDLFSNGEQDKRWIVSEGKRLLLKYGEQPYYEQPFNEVLASEICKKLEIPYVKYSVVIRNGMCPQVFSSCPCFIDENTEFVPAGFLQYVEKRQNSVSFYDHLINCCKKVGMKDAAAIESGLQKMLVLDYIVGNSDRHFGNFGFIRDADTLEWKGLTPVFDTGNAMFYDFSTSDLRKGRTLDDIVKCKSFAPTQEQLLSRFGKRFGDLNIDFDRLSGIEDYYRGILLKNPKADEERIELLTGILKRRINNLTQGILINNTVIKKFCCLMNEEKDDVSKNVLKVRGILARQNPEGVEVVNRYLGSFNAVDDCDFKVKLKASIGKTLKIMEKEKDDIAQEIGEVLKGMGKSSLSKKDKERKGIEMD